MYPVVDNTCSVFVSAYVLLDSEESSLVSHSSCPKPFQHIGVYFLCFFRPGGEFFSWDTSCGGTLRPSLGLAWRFKQIHSRNWHWSRSLYSLNVTLCLHKTQCSTATSGWYRSVCVDNSLLEWEEGGETNSLLELSPTKDFLLTFDYISQDLFLQCPTDKICQNTRWGFS